MEKRQKTLLMKSHEAKQVQRWFLVNASGKTLGRLASEIAKILRGKHKPTFTPHVDTGDGVIVINADQVHLTGSKEAQKEYVHYTGHIGGLKKIPFRMMKEKHPDYPLRHAVKGMMPKNKLGRAQLKRLRLFVGETHNMEAQQPIAVEI